MAGISILKKQGSNNQTGSLLTLAGMGAGAAFGGPGGAATGGSLGGMAGGLLTPAPSEGPGGISNDSDSAVQRRMMAKQEDSLSTLRESVTNLQQLPDPVRKEYAQPLLTAYVAEAKKRGVNPWEGMG